MELQLTNVDQFIENFLELHVTQKVPIGIIHEKTLPPVTPKQSSMKIASKMSQANQTKKKKKTTSKYIDRIENSIRESVTPTFNPILPNVEEYDVNVWKQYNIDLLKNINQQKVNLNWVEVYSRYSQFFSLYKTIKSKKFAEQEINKLIRETIPNDENIYSRTSFWRKAYDNLCLIFEVEMCTLLFLYPMNNGTSLHNFKEKTFDLGSFESKISYEKIIEKFRESHITINFFQEAEKEDIQKLINIIAGQTNLENLTQ
ncbi:3004_t:CDS:2 [Gigaspora margarita]|uniref:3004_t:CDS:1 n=1 Tax=Gigaspora margarita TaxID=4874 RepID=A0ABN7UZR1_GIGMA|nr:3004_t:CDS:2 [Gigaspora margarita]